MQFLSVPEASSEILVQTCIYTIWKQWVKIYRVNFKIMPHDIILRSTIFGNQWNRYHSMKVGSRVHWYGRVHAVEFTSLQTKFPSWWFCLALVPLLHLWNVKKHYIETDVYFAVNRTSLLCFFVNNEKIYVLLG